MRMNVLGLANIVDFKFRSFISDTLLLMHSMLLLSSLNDGAVKYDDTAAAAVLLYSRRNIDGDIS